MIIGSPILITVISVFREQVAFDKAVLESVHIHRVAQHFV